MTEEAEVVEVVPVADEAAPAAPAETKEAPAEEVKAPEAEPEEQHRSRAYRRLDRWRQRAIEAETRLKLTQEVKPVVREPEAGEPKRDQFGTYEEFIEARADWRGGQAAEKALKEAIKRENESRNQEAQQKQAREWTGRIDSARDEIEDFDEICSESDAPVTQAMSSAIMESDVGPKIAYYLAKNPGEAEKISKLSNSKQVAAIVALEEKVSKPVKTPTKAPAPINPVGKNASTDSEIPSDKDDINTWMRKERARMEKLGIR